MVGKTILHYDIIVKLGQGGMGVVYKAEDTKLKRPVAIKLLPHNIATDKTQTERFKIEAQAAAALNHPNIATIHAIEEKDNALFIVMEYIDGEELKDILLRVLNPREVADYALQIAKGLQAAHDKNIIHRDIKSSNIMVTKSGQIKIMDFGLAKIGDGANLTKDHSTVGTIAYMSPEQIQGQSVDKRADIFSFGVVLFEMLTGRLPFRGEYEPAMMYSIVNEEPTEVKSLRPDCPDYLADVICKCLQKNADDRFGSMQDIIQTFESQTRQSHATGFKREESSNHNLPLQLTSFIGREKEIKAAHELMQSNRLVSLTGAGGCGKTRLSIEIARGFVTQSADGVWFIELASITDGKQIPDAIAGALKIKEEPNVPLIDTICKNIAEKNMLLVIDNCEHVIQDATQVVIKILQAAPAVSILTSSREALNAPGEIAWRVPSLSLPDIEHLPEMNSLTEYEAVKLFIDRAWTINPNLKLSKDNYISIAKVCYRLDGIPLAIELASARLKLLGPDDILKRLDNRFQLLTGGSRSALERQKTLRATVDWSYNLLSNKEKVLFNRLSVFIGGCDLEAIEVVCGTDPLDAMEILDLLSALIDKSLVVADTQKYGSIRYRSLESIRHYGNEKLLESGEADKIRDAHFEYFLKLSENAYQTWREKTVSWINKLNADHENLRVALEWSKDKPIEHLRMVGYLHMFWFESCKFFEGMDYLGNALKNHRAVDEETARALTGYQRIELEVGGKAEEDFQEEILFIWRQIGNKKELGMGLIEYVLTLCMLNDLDTIINKITEAIDVFTELKDEYMLLRAEVIYGFGYVCLEQPEKATVIAEECLRKAKKLNAQWDYYFSYHYYADAALLMGDYKNGENRYGIALKEAAESGNTQQAAYEMRGISNCASGQGKYTKALRLSGAFEKYLYDNNMVENNVTFWAKMRDMHLGNARKALGAEAEQYEQEGRNMDFEKAVEYALDFNKD